MSLNLGSVFVVHAKSRRLELIGVTVRPSTLAGGVVSPAPAVVPDASSERIPIFADVSTAATL